jgi:predicted short-subunit dehydrogenase-like oxidoreductase (DUF2520 family)
MPSISIFGIGRMGGALAIALGRAGYDVDNLIHRGSTNAARIAGTLAKATNVVYSSSLPPLRSDIVLITTADPDIEPSADLILPVLENRPVVLHTSGSLSSAVLAKLADAGCSTGSLHPLVSISDSLSGADRFAGVYFCIEGDDAAQSAARTIVERLNGRPFSIDSDRKPLYHAAAVTAAGHVTALVDVAIEMLSECGVDRQTAQRVLMPLVISTVENLESQTPAQALTGTFARADVEAVNRHLTAMDTAVTPEPIRDIYLMLGERSLELAATNGADATAVQKVREAISIAKRKSE